MSFTTCCDVFVLCHLVSVNFDFMTLWYVMRSHIQHGHQLWVSQNSLLLHCDDSNRSLFPLHVTSFLRSCHQFPAAREFLTPILTIHLTTNLPYIVTILENRRTCYWWTCVCVCVGLASSRWLHHLGSSVAAGHTHSRCNGNRCL